MTSKPEIKITSRKQNIHKLEKNKKPIQSNFFMTINLNQQYHKDEHIQNIDYDMQVFDDLINEMLQNIDQYIKLPEGVEYNDDTVNDVSADYVVEIGSQKKTNTYSYHVKIQTLYKDTIRL